MKLISGDRAFVYYIRDRSDGKSHGIRIGRTTGAVGFVSNTPVARQTHPVPFEAYDNPVELPVSRDNNLPPILANVLGDVELEHPEIHDILSGRISFEDVWISR